MKRPPASAEELPVPNERLFRRNLGIVAAVHALFVLIVFVAGRWTAKPVATPIVWLNGGVPGGGESIEEDAAPEEVEEPLVADSTPPEPDPLPVPEVETPAPSEIVQPVATPPPATPKPATPKPATPKPATPKPATPKPSPPPSTPKPATPKASPKPGTPKPKATPKAEGTPKPASKPGGTPAPKASEASAGSGEKKGSEAKAAAAGNGSGTGPGKGTGKSGTGTGASDFGWYFEKLHDAFYARWEKPFGVGPALVTTLKLRIQKDGKIASSEVVKSSGNPQLDESVLAAAQKVGQIDPPPAGLGNGDFLDLNVNFKSDE